MIPQRYLASASGMMRIVLALLFVATSCKVPSKDRTLEAEGAWLASSRGFNDDVRAFMVRYRAADEAEQRRMLDDATEPRHKWTPRMRALALRFRGDPAAVRFDRWLLQNGGIIEPRFADEAAERITSGDLSGRRMLKVPSALRFASCFRGKEKTLADLDAIARRSSDREVRTEALRQRELLLHPAPAKIVTGMQAPLLRGVDFDGRPVDLAQHRGEIVLLNFWGAWCGPCVARMPMMKRVAERFAGARFALIGINSDADRVSALRFVRAKNISWRNVADGGPAGPVASAWSVTHWPFVIIIAGDGRVAAVEPSDDAIVPTINELLRTQSKTQESGHAL